MQIVTKSAEGLARVFAVTVPAADLAERLEARIKDVAPQVSIKGFRPGKVPPAHVKRLYGKSIMAEMINDVIQEGVTKAVNDNAVRPATQPQVAGLDGVDQAIDGKGDLSFDVSLEILPEFTPVDIKTLKLDRPVAPASDADVAEALEEIRKQSQAFETKAGTAADGDQLVIDFVGKIDGEAFAGGTATGATLVIGSNTYIPGFEAQLTGVQAGDAKTISVSFPADYGVDTLSGKDATFDVTVTEVKSPVDSKVDDELAKSVGLSDLEALKTALKTDIERQLKDLSRQKAKRALLDALDAAHSFDLPPQMVDAEFGGIWSQVEKDKASGQTDPEDAGKSDDELKAEYRKIAERRVRLGLVLAEIGRVNGVEVSDDEVNNAFRRQLAQFPGQEQMLIDFYQKNPQMVAQLRAPIYEEKVVDFVLQMADVTDVAVTRAELEADDDAPAPAAKAEEAAKPKKAAGKKAKAAEATDDAATAEAAPAEATAAGAGDEAAKPKRAPARKKKTDAAE
jgi:trigger factor